MAINNFSNIKYQISNIKLRNRFATIFILMILLGVGCAKQNPELNFDRMREILFATGVKLEWTGDVMEKQPSADNDYGHSLILNGPVRQESIETVESTNIEIIEFDNEEYALRSYQRDECFKGRGEPIKIYGMEGCCLNNNTVGKSQAIMKNGKYIFKSFDFFHANCKAGENLKVFWGRYLNK